MATILYARCSTSDQTSAHQKDQAAAAGFEIDWVIDDEGVSGISVPLRERPGGKRLFDKLRSGDTLVVRWVDRLGRNYDDVTNNIRAFMEMGVIVRTVINNMTFDGSTTDPMQKAIRDAMISFMAASAQAQTEATKLAAKAGHAHRKKLDPNAYKGRKPTYNKYQLNEVIRLLNFSTGVNETARLTGLSKFTVSRIKADISKALQSVEKWSV